MGKFNEYLNKKIVPIPALYKNPYLGILKDLVSKENKGETVAKEYVKTQLDADYLNRIKNDIYEYPPYAKALEVPMLQDLKNIYLKTPQTFSSFGISKYRPKNGTQPYYFNSKILDTVGAGIVVKAGDNLKKEEVVPTDKLEDMNYGELSHITPNNNAVAVLPGLGHSTVGIGHDEKGEYVSYYDNWDVGNFKPNTKHLIDFFNKSVPVYGRVYLDDYYDIPEEARGNPFITPAVVTAETKKSGGIIKAQNSAKLISKINQSDANFVKRLLDPNRKSIPDWETKGQKIATHKMSWGEDDQGAYVFPEVQEIDDQLIDFSRPPYAPGIADYMAHKNNNIIRMSPEEADWFTRNYKQYYPSFKKGGRIHIKKKNRGSFTRWCKGKVTEECIRRGKNSPNPAIRKKATFAANSRRWKHENGGILKAQDGTGNNFWSKLWNAIKEGGMAARDAKIGAVGAQQVRDLYSEGKNQEAQDLAKQYAKANTTGIALAGGAASTGLLGDLMVTGATTTADTFIDGDVDNFGKNLVKNAAGDLIGHGTSKLLTHLRTNELNKYIDYLNESRRQELFPKSEDVYYHIDTDGRPLFNTNAKLHPSKDASRVLPGLARDEGDIPYIWFNRRATYGTPKHDRIVFGSKEDLHLKPIQETNLPHNEVEGFYVTEGYPNTDKIQMYRGYPISIGGTKPIYVFGKEIFYAPK